MKGKRNRRTRPSGYFNLDNGETEGTVESDEDIGNIDEGEGITDECIDLDNPDY